jgi:hypothetical protein
MPRKYTDEQLDAMTPDQLAQALGEAWGSNDMDTFLSMFTPDAEIHHPIFSQAIVTPKQAADVLNSAVKGTTTFLSATLRPTAGFQGLDQIDMAYEETGVQAGFTPVNTGVMKVTGTLKNNRFKVLHVHGYDIK